MTQLAALKKATGLHDLALLLGYKKSALSYILYQIPDENKYNSFQIPKRSGGVRNINAPVEKLKLLQRKLAIVLENCISELEQQNNYSDQSTHGFKKGKSILTNARMHRAKRWVFNVDLENFFGTINFGRVRGFFIKDRNFALSPVVATIIAQIACFENALAQGAPSSPVISNLIGHILDVKLIKLASQFGCHYTRYVDDITFSTNMQDFPLQIGSVDASLSNKWAAGPELLTAVNRSGFDINPKKTRMQYQNSRQDVTGLVVNRKVNVCSEYRRTVRAMVNRLLTHGHFEHKKITKSEAGEWVESNVAGTTEELHGMLGFIESVDKFNISLSSKKGGKVRSGEKNTLEYKRLGKDSGKDLLYRRFLLYKEFFAADRPVILCEGETDNVYLIHAIRSLAGDFPMLAKVSPNGETKIVPRLYKYVNTNTGQILGLGSGGTGDLGKLVKNYIIELKRLVRPKEQHPFIILIDNDSGAVGGGRPLDVLRKMQGEIDRSAPYIFVGGNLYLVPTPLLGKEESMIEDFFDDQVLQRQLDGKSFSKKNKMNNAHHFGKAIFAHRIVRPNADAISFAGFCPLLHNIALAMQDFYNKKPMIS